MFLVGEQLECTRDVDGLVLCRLCECEAVFLSSSKIMNRIAIRIAILDFVKVILVQHYKKPIGARHHALMGKCWGY